MSKIEWTAKDNINSFKEGWCLFADDDDSFYILTLDDPALALYDVGLEIDKDYDGTAFKYDDDALRFVRFRAAVGDKTAIKALKLTGED